MRKFKFHSALIMTCEKYFPQAQQAQSRLEKYGFGKIPFIFACEYIVSNRLAHTMLFEEDAVLIKEMNKKSLIIFEDVYEWCINNLILWDIVNFGGVPETPIFPIHLHLGYARCVLGSSILVSQTFAEKFLHQVKTQGAFDPFDSHIARTCWLQLKCIPSIFTQHTTPIGAEFVKIEPVAKLHTILDKISIASTALIATGSCIFISVRSYKYLFVFWLIVIICILLVFDFAQHFASYKFAFNIPHPN
jgi:hypothetical protein